jgi:precorrin-6B methylase 2
MLAAIIAKNQNAVTHIIVKHRENIGYKIYRQTGGKIIAGPFRGVRIPKGSTWSGFTDHGSIICGLYEQQILELLKDRTFNDVVVAGAGWGYYPISICASGKARRAFLFESDFQNSSQIEEAIEANGVRDQIVVLGEATCASIDSLKNFDFNSQNSLVISDLEGFEYDFFTRNTLNYFKYSELIIELHEFDDWMSAQAQKLLERVNEHFEFIFVEGNSRTYSQEIVNLNLSEQDKVLLAEEGRPNHMRWIYCVPKQLEVS